MAERGTPKLCAAPKHCATYRPNQAPTTLPDITEVQLHEFASGLDTSDALCSNFPSEGDLLSFGDFLGFPRKSCKRPFDVGKGESLSVQDVSGPRNPQSSPPAPSLSMVSFHRAFDGPTAGAADKKATEKNEEAIHSNEFARAKKQRLSFNCDALRMGSAQAAARQPPSEIVMHDKSVKLMHVVSPTFPFLLKPDESLSVGNFKPAIPAAALLPSDQHSGTGQQNSMIFNSLLGGSGFRGINNDDQHLFTSFAQDLGLDTYSFLTSPTSSECLGCRMSPQHDTCPYSCRIPHSISSFRLVNQPEDLDLYIQLSNLFQSEQMEITAIHRLKNDYVFLRFMSGMARISAERRQIENSKNVFPSSRQEVLDSGCCIARTAGAAVRTTITQYPESSSAWAHPPPHFGNPVPIHEPGNHQGGSSTLMPRTQITTVPNTVSLGRCNLSQLDRPVLQPTTAHKLQDVAEAVWLSLDISQTEVKDCNLALLFHTTRNLRSVCETGLDPSFSSPKCRMGPAVYLSDTVRKSATYFKSSPTSRGDQYLLVCAAALGEVQSFRLAQSKKCKISPHTFFDNTVGREYACKSADQVYPLMVVFYRNKNNTRDSQSRSIGMAQQSNLVIPRCMHPLRKAAPVPPATSIAYGTQDDPRLTIG